MIPCLIKNKRGFNLMEMLIAVSFTTFLMMGLFGFYNMAAQSYNSGVSGQNLQDGANLVLGKIAEGDTESSNVYRLDTAVSYLIPNGVGTALYTCGGSTQTASCNTTWTAGELYFCQDSPCTPSDTTARWYYLNSAGTAIMYHYPNETNGKDVAIYQAPTGSLIALRFVSTTNNPSHVVRIDAAMTRTVAASVTNLRLQTSGAVTTYVLLRNHP